MPTITPLDREEGEEKRGESVQKYSSSSDKLIIEKWLRTPFCPFSANGEYFDSMTLFRFTPAFRVVPWIGGAFKCFSHTSENIAEAVARGGFNPLNPFGRVILQSLHTFYRRKNHFSDTCGTREPFEDLVMHAAMVVSATESAVFVGKPVLEQGSRSEFEILSSMTGIDGPIQDCTRDTNPFPLWDTEEEAVEKSRKKAEEDQEGQRQNQHNVERARAIHKQNLEKARKEAEKLAHSKEAIHPKPDSPTTPPKEEKLSSSSSSSSPPPPPPPTCSPCPSSQPRKTGRFSTFSDISRTPQRHEPEETTLRDTPGENKFGTPNGFGSGFPEKEVDKINEDIYNHVKHIFAGREAELPQYREELREFLDGTCPKTREGILRVAKFLKYVSDEQDPDEPFKTFLEHTWKEKMLSSLPSGHSCDEEASSSDDTKGKEGDGSFFNDPVLSKRFREFPEEEKHVVSKTFISPLCGVIAIAFPKWVPFVDLYLKCPSIQSIPHDKKNNVICVLYFISCIFFTSLPNFISDYLVSLFKSSSSSGHSLSDGKTTSSSSSATSHTVTLSEIDISGTPSARVFFILRTRKGDNTPSVFFQKALQVNENLSLEDVVSHFIRLSAFPCSGSLRISVSYWDKREVPLNDISKTVHQLGLNNKKVFITIYV